MGFFEKLNNFMQGKPVFEPEDSTVQPKTDTNVAHDNAVHGVERQGVKLIPQIRLEETDCHVSGHHMEVRAVIKNESSQQLEIDKIFILGVKREIDVHLRPHEARQAVLYNGPRPNHQNYGQADLNYRTTESPVDYFQIKCRVEFQPEKDNTYSVRRITQQGPVKDIQ
jgi:hypothetical protein